MLSKNAVLVIDEIEEKSVLDVMQVDEKKLPDMLNGESGFHIFHVRILTELILCKLKEDKIIDISDDEITAISIASSLHDIGKSRVPKSILDFPGKLSPLEFDIVKKHAIFGEQIINESDFSAVGENLKKYACEIARHHHERIDGTGYPDALKGEAIPVSAQVVALADSYDALTSSRSYKDAFSQDVAIQMISSGMCGVFDENLINSLMKVVNHSELVQLRRQLNEKRAVVSSDLGFVPERVLCIGNTEYLTREFIEDAFPKSKVMVIGNSELGSDDKLKLFRIKKPSIKALFETYEFDLIVYFSGELTYHTSEKNDSHELREVLRYAKQLQTNTKMIFLSSLDACYKIKTDKGILSGAEEDLCKFHSDKTTLDIKVVRIPYLYSGTYEKDFLYKVFDDIVNKRTCVFKESPGDSMHFISMQDLSSLLARLIDNWISGAGILTVTDDFGLSFVDLVAKLRTLSPDVSVDFLASVAPKQTELNNRVFRNEYGWFARISILEELQFEFEKFILRRNEKPETFLDKIKSWLEKHSLLIKIAELVILFILTELMLLLTDSAVIFSIVDFRLIYIVVMATVHGLNFGLMSAALSSISWLYAKVMSGTAMLTIFYEPTNWLAFVFFFLVGALCGYVKIKNDDRIKFVEGQNNLLEDKLVFMHEIYEDTYREKRDLKKQIIGSKDSFGKIFDITRKLDTVEPKQLYLRIMETFEDVLENKNITVYSINKGNVFGRLEVASRDIIDNVSRSISTETYKEVIEKLSGGEIFKNTELRPDLPMYAAGVYRGQELVLLIFLWHCDVNQRSLYYVNLFKILRDLVQMSLLRAFDYTNAIYDKQYIENTHIMNSGAFGECLKNYQALAEKKVSSHILLGIDKGDMSYSQMSEILSKKIRASDVMGVDENGKLYVLLSQASEKDLQYILPRFEDIKEIVTVL